MEKDTLKDELTGMKAKLHTDGHGLWTSVARQVTITAIRWQTSPPNEYRKNPETLVWLDLDRTWVNKRDGLIYTDRKFRAEARALLMKLAEMGQLPKELPWHDLNYTEQGMQGGHYNACEDGCRNPKHRPSVSMILGAW